MSKSTAINLLNEMITERDDGFNQVTVKELRDVLAELEAPEGGEP